MDFTKRLREGVRSGDITCSVRIWMHPRVKAGNRYGISGGGEIEVESIDEIELADITPKLARESGFASVVDLLKTAQHGRGRNVYLVRFHYVPVGASAPASNKEARPRAAAATPRGKKKVSADRERNRILRILKQLPEADAIAYKTHLSLEVRKKRFGYFLDDHHGDGRIALNCKATPDVREMLQDTVPAQFHIPKYVGNKGWVGLWLDGADVEWSAVELAVREAYLLVAPKTLVRARPKPAASKRRR